MPGLPYLPGGVTELPANRFVLWADGTNQIQRLDESAVQKDGADFTGHWETGTLNQIGEGREYTLHAMELIYSALANTTITVYVSGDGGEIFSAGQQVTIPITAGRIDRVIVGLSGLDEATGFDLRFRIELDTNVLVNIFGYRPHFADRGDLIA